MPHIAGHVPLILRAMLRRPARSVALAAFVGACLALNAAVFAVVDGAIFKPLPFPDADRLVRIGLDLRERGGVGPGPVSLPQLSELQQSPGLGGIAASTSGALAADRSADDSLRSVGVTPGFFELLGGTPRLGRALLAHDSPAGAEVPVVIGDRLWRARYGAAGTVIGTRVFLGGVACRIVGIAPPGFEAPAGANVWNVVNPSDATLQEFAGLSAIARLEPGASCPAAAAGAAMLCEPLRQSVSPRHAASLLLVLVAATALMAMTWFQVVCLELARTLTRIRETGVRLSLGATRGALATEAFAQGSFIALAALGVSAVIVPAVLAWLVALLPPEVSRGQPIASDARAMAFASVLAVGVVASYVLIPLYALARADATTSIRDAPAGVQRTRVWAPWLIVVAQVALSTALISLTALTARSMWKVSRVDLGYAPSAVAVVRLPSSRPVRGGSPGHDALAARLAAFPSIAAVAGADSRPLGGPTTMVPVGRLGEQQGARARMVSVTPHYFAALGVALVGGREFTASDSRGSPFVVIVNRPLARRLGLSRWKDGHRVRLLGFAATVVGLVGEPVLSRPDDPDRETVFVPSAQWAPVRYLLLRATDDGAAGRMMDDAAAIMGQEAPAGTSSILWLKDEARRVTAGYRSRMILLVGIGAIGLVLCAAGVYGAVTYAWTHVRRDVAVRLALGATPAGIRVHLLRTLACWSAPGLLAGVLLGAAASRLGSAFLFGISPFDATALAAAVLVVGSACALAAAVPAIRVGRVQPSELLREQ